MKRKIYLLFTALLMMATTSAWAQTVTVGNLTYSLDTNSKTATIQGDRNYSNDTLSIPATITYGDVDYKVTAIANDGAFQGAEFKYLKFDNPSNITNIPNWCFANCNYVAEIEIPEGVESLNSYDNWSLGQMKSLRKIILPSTLQKIGGYALANDANLETIIFKNSNPPSSIGDNAFTYLSDPLKGYSATTPANITVVVPDGAVTAYTNKLTSWGFKKIIQQSDYDASNTITHSDVKIGDYYYDLKKEGDADGTAYLTESNQNCTVVDVVIPSSVTYMEDDGTTYTYNVVGLKGQTFRGGEYGDKNSAKIKTLTFLSDTLDYSQCRQPFEDMRALTSIKLPPTDGTVTAFPGGWAFDYCNSLTELALPDGMTQISERELDRMTSLKYLTIPASVTSIIGYNFADDRGDEATFHDSYEDYFVFCKGGTPPNIVWNNNSYLKNAIAVVNDETAKLAYQKDDNWNQLKAIITQADYDKERVSIIWNIVDDNGATIASDTIKDCIPTLTYTTSFTSVYGVTLSGNTTVTAGDGNMIVNLTYAIDSSKWAFQLSSSYDNAIWYQMQIRNKYCSYNSYSKGISVGSTTAPSKLAKKNIFAFVGTPFGFRIYNAEAGKDSPFGPSTCKEGTLLTSTTDDNSAVLTYLKGNNGTYNIFRYRDDALGYLNDYSNKLGVWHVAGALNNDGSNLAFTKLHTLDELRTLLSEAKRYDNVICGTDPGCYSEDGVKQLHEAVSAAQKIDTTDVCAVSNAYTSLSNAASALVVPITEGYYFVTSAGNGPGYYEDEIPETTYNYEDKFALYNEGGVVKWKTYDKTDASQIYRFTASTDGNWNVYNVSDSTYINTAAGESGCNCDVTTTSEAATAASQIFELVNDGSGKYAIHSGKTYDYALVSSYDGPDGDEQTKGNTTGNLSIWGDTEEAKTYGVNVWYLHRVNITDVAKLIGTQAPEADVLDVVFNADGSATDISAQNHTVDAVYKSSTADTATNYNRDYGKYEAKWGDTYRQNSASHFYKIDYVADDALYNAIKDGHTLQTTFVLTKSQSVTGSTAEAKMLGSTSSGGTALLLYGPATADQGGKLQFVAHVGGGWKKATSGINAEVGKIYNVVGVWDGDSVKIYVNGEWKASAPASGTFKFPSNTARYWFCVGGSINGAKTNPAANCSAPWNILSARIYSRPLTDMEVAALYNQEQFEKSAVSRSLSAGLNTACEPFAVNATDILDTNLNAVDGVKLYTYEKQNADANTVVFTDVTKTGVAAGVPCLIEMPEGASGTYYFNFKDSVKTYVSAPDNTNGVALGTFTRIDPLGEGYYKLNQVEDKQIFLPTVEKSIVAPFRFYLKLPNAGSNSYAISLGDDDDITGLTDTTTSVEKQVVGIYDVSGRKYSGLQKGINILKYSDGSSVKIIVK